jgi:hypothetical protein
MDILVAVVFLGLLMLVWVICLTGLSASSKMLARSRGKEVVSSRQDVCLLWLAFLSTLAFLIWRMS